jgi:la-related protein 1
MSSTTHPALPAFSYAQAARGLQSGAASSQKSTDVSATSSEKGAQGRLPSLTDEQKEEVRSKSPATKAGIASPSTMEMYEDQPPQNWGTQSDLSESTNADLVKRHEAEQASKTTTSPTIVSLSEPEPLWDHKGGEVSTGPNGASNASEKLSEASMAVDKAVASDEKDRSPVADSDWEDGSLPSNSQPKELKAAPAPPFNFWEQRMLAQDAARAQIAQRPPSSSGKSVLTSGPAADSTKTKTPQERDATSKRKPSESAKTTTDKTVPVQATQGRPTSRGQSSTQTSVLPPPVGDAMAWPTPETAIEAEDRRKSSLDTNEKPEVKPTGTKQKKWTQVPFVPTAVFNTPLPPAAAKRGGRGSLRGGRDGTGRGGHMSQNSISGDKSEVVGSMGPPPLPRHADQDRGRRPQPAQGVRAISAPTHERQATSAAGTQTEPPKVSGSGQSLADPATVDEPASSKAQESRSSSRPADVSSKEVLNGNAEATEPTLTSENDHAHPIIDQVARVSISSEWYGNKPVSSNPRTIDSGNRERGQPRTRNNYQESRDKVESWRDHGPPSDTTTRRDPRSERGTRGSYRARGINPSYVPGSTHANTAPLPQQPFAPSKSQSYDTRQRQSSNYIPHAPPGSGRGVHRSQSIPTQQQLMQSGMPPLSPIQTDIQPYPYNPMMYSGGYISAVPQHPALDMYGLMSLVTAQL